MEVGTPSGTCQATPGTVPDGWPCGCTADCAQGAVCDSEVGSGAPGGNCARICKFGGPAVCSAGAICPDFGVSNGASICSANCTTNADCPPHRYCDNSGFCLAFCFGDSDCESNHCDTYANVCTATAQQTTGGGIGVRCAIDADCRSGNCGSGGRCVTSCSISDGRCPEEGVCVQSTSDVHLDLGFCFAACTAGHLCADTSFSCSATGIPQDEEACFPRGTAATCAGPPAVPDSDGLPCGCGDDCSYGAGCLTESSSGIAHGFCRRQCAPPNGTPCGAGYVCDQDVCYRVCAVDTDCGAPGRICTNQRECLPLCASNAECAGGVCDPYTGSCTATAATGLPMGAACSVDADCKSGACDPTAHYCYGPCRVHASICPDGTVCAPADATSSSDFGFCYPPCTDQTNCTALGLTCVATTNAPIGTPMHCQ